CAPATTGVESAHAACTVVRIVLPGRREPTTCRPERTSASSLDLPRTFSTAASAFTTPQPAVGVQPAPSGRDAVCSSTLATCTFVSDGAADHTSAAMPATSGAAKLVPLEYAYRCPPTVVKTVS